MRTFCTHQSISNQSLNLWSNSESVGPKVLVILDFVFVFSSCVCSVSCVVFRPYFQNCTLFVLIGFLKCLFSKTLPLNNESIRWCNSYRALIEFDMSCVGALIGSNQRLWNWNISFSSKKCATIQSRNKTYLFGVNMMCSSGMSCVNELLFLYIWSNQYSFRDPDLTVVYFRGFWFNQFRYIWYCSNWIQL